jgi:enoyl-CoA hydratase/carnithine racemase
MLTSLPICFRLLATILDFPFPTVALITGHVMGGACLLTLAHDYRVMNSQRGYWQMPPVNAGLHHEGMGVSQQSGTCGFTKLATDLM